MTVITLRRVCLRCGYGLLGLVIFSAPLAFAQCSSWDRNTDAGQKALSEHNFDVAELIFRDALYEAKKSGAYILYASAANQLAMAHDGEQKTEDADHLYQESIAWLEQQSGESLALAGITENYSAFLRCHDPNTDTSTLDNRAAAIRAQHPTGRN